MCGYTNHNTFDCKRGPLWNLGRELCAAQVPYLSFFFIDEHIDAKASKEKSSTAIITVFPDVLASKLIEMEFKNIVSGDISKWNARQIAENKFSMRFRTTKMVQDYSNFKLGLKSMDAQLLIEPWNSAMGAKGELQQA